VILTVCLSSGGRPRKALADYQAQLNRAFEHEDKLKTLLARQAQLNAALDLDKGERQIAQDSRETDTNDIRAIPHTGGGTHATTSGMRDLGGDDYGR
jgi:hypothetical protein